MQRIKAATIALALTCASVAHGQQIEWKQTINLPKGLNMPQGVTADILGLELGDNYEVAKAKLDKIRADAKLPEDHKRLTIINRNLRIPTPGQNLIQISYVGGLRLDISRVAAGATPRGDESVTLIFSAPSSGHQLIGVKRIINYVNQDEQVRISELTASLKSKFGEPFVQSRGSTWEYAFQFDNGKRAALSGIGPTGACSYSAVFGNMNSDVVNHLNRDGSCDVVLKVDIVIGISADHTKHLTFWLTDSERAKRNITADFAFFNDYAKSYQQRSGGTAPKL